MKKALLATISVMACFSVQAKNVSDADIEKYLAAHPEAIERYMGNQQKPVRKESFLEALQPAPASVIDEIVNSPIFYSVGNPKGTFVIIEFFDYQCGWCKKSHQALTKIMESKKAKNIRLIPVPTPIFGESSELISKYVLAAGKQGKFKEMHHEALTAGVRLDEEGLLNIARELGLDTARLTKDATGDEIAQVLETANSYKSKMNISGVPMFIVNGKIQPGAIIDDKAQEILDAQGTMPIFKGSDNVKVTARPPHPHHEPRNKNQGKPTEYASKIAPDIMDTIKKGRSMGIIQPDGRIEVSDEKGKFSGKILCSDSELERKLQAWDTELNSKKTDEEKLRKSLDEALRCLSISNLEFKDRDFSIKFKGNYKFPAFSDNSHGTIVVSDKTIDVSFKLNGNKQKVDINVQTNTGAKLGIISFEYDAERMAIPFEWGVMGQLIDYVTRFDVHGSRMVDFEAKMARQFQIWAEENNLLTEKVFKVNKVEIYQPDGKKVLILNGADENKYILRIFNSVGREFFNAFLTDKYLKSKLSFPQSGGRILESETKFSPNFMENYKKFSAKYQSQLMQKDRSKIRMEASAEQLVQLLAGLKEEATLHSVDGQPLARLKLKLNDTIVSTNRPEDVIDYATLSILKPSMNCSVRSVSFSKITPNEMTVCDASGCAQQSPLSAISKIESCLDKEMEAISEKFSAEIKDEMNKLEQVYIPGVSEGYNLATSRYRANEILNAAALVAITAMSRNGGMGGDADLSDLGGYKVMKLDGFVLSDYAIRGNKEGVVTIEVDPKIAKDVIPVIKDLSGSRVESGCTPDTNICVLNMAKKTQ